MAGGDLNTGFRLENSNGNLTCFVTIQMRDIESESRQGISETNRNVSVEIIATSLENRVSKIRQ